MRYALLFVLGIALLAAGCTGQQPGAAAPTMICADYCPSQPHADCTGSWASSGAYPACTCTFKCVPANQSAGPSPSLPPANASPQPQDISPPANQTAPPAANISPPAQPSAPVVDKPVDTLLSDALDSARIDFYSGNSGSFQENRNVWVRTPVQAAPGELEGTAPASNVKFNGAAIESIEASGFIAFTNTGTDVSRAVGVAIFGANSTPLDGLSNFTVVYFPPIINKSLGVCNVYDTLRQETPNGSPLLTYYFRCDGVVGT